MNAPETFPLSLFPDDDAPLAEQAARFAPKLDELAKRSATLWSISTSSTDIGTAPQLATL